MDEAETKDGVFDWDKLTGTMEKDEKIMLNYLQEILIKKGYFQHLEVNSSEEEDHIRIRNEGAKLIRSFIEYLIDSMQAQDGMTISSSNTVLSQGELKKLSVVETV